MVGGSVGDSAETGAMRFSYRESLAAPSPDAYETLLWDAMKCDATFFMRAGAKVSRLTSAAPLFWEEHQAAARHPSQIRTLRKRAKCTEIATAHCIAHDL